VIDPASEIRQEVFGSDLKGELRALVKARALRPFLRLALIAAWTAGGLVTLLTGLWLLALAPRLALRWRRRMVTLWARGLAWIAGMRISITGPLPEAPFVLVANHLSYVDIVLLFRGLGCVFVAKQELRHWPILGYLTRRVGTIFVDRRLRRDAVRVVDEIGAAIARGDGVVVFPEGTSSPGDGVYPMKPALLEWAAREGFPVRCAALGYQTPPGAPPPHLAVCWWGDMTFAPHLMQLLRLPGFQATIDFVPEPIVSRDRAELAARAREEIARRFRPVLPRKTPRE